MMRQDIGTLVALLAVLTVTSCDVAKQVHQEESLFGPSQVIDSAIGSPGDVLAHDLDGDGDLDVLCVAESISWYENVDGHGHFGGARHVLEDARLATTAEVADIDGDGDLDVATADVPAWRSGRLMWFANEVREGQVRFSAAREISRRYVYPEWIVLDDLDGDGDADAVAGIGIRDNILAWFENLGDGRFSSAPRMSKQDRANAVVTEDLDGDGAPDLLLAGSSSIRWYRNELVAHDGGGGFDGPRNLTRAHGAFSLSAADLDGDGDSDVLAAASRGR